MAETSPRPTQKAFVPMDNQNLRRGVLLGVFCLLIGLFGTGLLLYPKDGFALLGPLTWTQSSEVMIIMLFSPVMLLAGLYFLYTTWRDWRNRVAFDAGGQQATGTITHIWAEIKPKAYFVGFEFNGQSVYQEISRGMFNQAKVGDTVTVMYVPQHPKLARMIEPEGKPAKQKKAKSKVGD